MCCRTTQSNKQAASLHVSLSMVFCPHLDCDLLDLLHLCGDLWIISHLHRKVWDFCAIEQSLWKKGLIILPLKNSCRGSGSFGLIPSRFNGGRSFRQCCRSRLLSSSFKSIWRWLNAVPWQIGRAVFTVL